MKKLIKSSLPIGFKIWLVQLKTRWIDDFGTRSYSQEGEDMILKRVFETQKHGFYVDVGAHHPKRFSNTYYFYRKGWHGINIDAMPKSMQAFERVRPRDINIEIPISSKKQVLTYYGFNDPALNGFSKELSEARDGNHGCKIEFTQKIETQTLQSIFDQYLKNQVIDFLSIDVEGLDFDVLKSIDFVKNKPRMVLIELLGSKLAEIANEEIYLFLVTKGYHLYAKSVCTLFFKSNDF